MQSLRKACEQAKCKLSEHEITEIRLPKLAGGIDFLKRVTREEFEQKAQALFERCIPPIEKALKDSKMAFDDINDVVMVGGSSRIPKLKRDLEAHYGEGINISDREDPDQVVALGATFLAR